MTRSRSCIESLPRRLAIRSEDSYSWQYPLPPTASFFFFLNRRAIEGEGEEIPSGGRRLFSGLNQRTMERQVERSNGEKGRGSPDWSIWASSLRGEVKGRRIEASDGNGPQAPQRAAVVRQKGWIPSTGACLPGEDATQELEEDGPGPARSRC